MSAGADTADPASAGNHDNNAHERPTFVTPRTYLEQGRPTMPPRAMTAVDREQLDGLVSFCRAHAMMTTPTHIAQRTIRAFLKVRTSYDVLPLSFRLIVFDTALLVKKSLNILIQNGGFFALAICLLQVLG
jgi:5'-AMP-activated protein kinase regulatory gamma subunit